MIFRLFVCSANEVAKRQKYVGLVDSVRENGGEVRIFSSLHVSGERTYRLLFYLLFYYRCCFLSLLVSSVEKRVEKLWTNHANTCAFACCCL